MAMFGFLGFLNPMGGRKPAVAGRRIGLEMTTAPKATESEYIQHQPKEMTPEQEAAVFATDEIDSFLHFGTWLPVASSNIAAMRYFPEESKLEVEFRNGNFYAVFSVSIREAESLAKSASKGKWYWRNIRVMGKGNFFATRKPFAYLFGPKPPQWLRSAKTRKIHALFTKGAAIRKPKFLGKSIEKILMPRGRKG